MSAWQGEDKRTLLRMSSLICAAVFVAVRSTVTYLSESAVTKMTRSAADGGPPYGSEVGD